MPDLSDTLQLMLLVKEKCVNILNLKKKYHIDMHQPVDFPNRQFLYTTILLSLIYKLNAYYVFIIYVYYYVSVMCVKIFKN
jgi:hypothetical protein